jgi:hypothetical protein
MPSDKNPVFRKAVIPWYNSKTAYIIVIVFLLLVFLFAMVGIIITTIARLIKRYTRKSTK